MIFSWLKQRQRNRGKPNHGSRFRPQVELLEDRRVPAVITVNGTADTIVADGVASLREAIKSINDGMDANGDVTAARQGNYGVNDTINFMLGAMPLPINLATSLTITRAMTINGYSQAGSQVNTAGFGMPMTTILQVRLVNAGGFIDGIQIHTNDTTIKGLVIEGFGDDGIEIEGNNNKIQGNFIGTNDLGTTIAFHGMVAQGGSPR
jgi:hypothetical protein